jgi:hypothetical protein
MFESLIETKSPFTGSQARKVVMGRPQTYMGGDGAAGNSRAAFSRATADMGRNKAASTLDQYRRKFQSQTEQARSEDLLYQQAYGNAAKKMELDRVEAGRQQAQAMRQGTAALDNYRSQARQQAGQNVLGSVVGAIFGQGNLMRAAPLFGEALAGGARPFGGFGGGSGLMSSLLGR